MIPPFNEHGYLPPGIHQATLDEIAERFGKESELRQAQMESLRWLVELARRTGVIRIMINGSFVTDVREPNDVDCVILTAPDYPRDAAADQELDDGLPFIDLKLVREAGFDYYTSILYASDRDLVPKGMIEIAL